MTTDELATLQREFLIKTEKQSAIFLFAEFAVLSRNIKDYLINNKNLIEAGEVFFITQFIDKLSIFFDLLAMPFEKVVRQAQKQLIGFASDSLTKFFKSPKIKAQSPNLKTLIFDKDLEAIEKLIGQTQSKEALSKYFTRMKPDILDRARTALIDGFANGDGVDKIARRINDVSNIGRYNALRISRTETNEAYRTASREFYKSAGIKKYVWLSVLDSRVCLRCWFLHGHKFNSNKKIFSHPMCRCVLVPYLPENGEMETGVSKFNKLTDGQKREILGAKRFELFTSGKSLSSFIETKESKDFGTKPLD